MSAYYEGENGIKLGNTERVGKLLESTTNNIEYGLLGGSKSANEEYNSHNIELKAEEDRLDISGNFAENSTFEVILTKGFEKRTYKFRATKQAHAALCISTFVSDNTKEGEAISIERYINGEGLSGLYNIYIKLGDTIYDTEKSIKF